MTMTPNEILACVKRDHAAAWMSVCTPNGAKRAAQVHPEDYIHALELILIRHEQNAEAALQLAEWEEFGRQIEKRLCYNTLGLVGSYPEMIDTLLADALRLLALEQAMADIGFSQKMYVQLRADEILREWKEKGCDCKFSDHLRTSGKFENIRINAGDWNAVRKIIHRLETEYGDYMGRLDIAKNLTDALPENAK